MGKGGRACGGGSSTVLLLAFGASSVTVTSPAVCEGDTGPGCAALGGRWAGPSGLAYLPSRSLFIFLLLYFFVKEKEREEGDVLGVFKLRNL